MSEDIKVREGEIIYVCGYCGRRYLTLVNAEACVRKCKESLKVK